MPKRKVPLEGIQSKPSLASLKPDRSKGQAAQKRAIKRIVATASKKTSAVRIKKISDSLSISTTPKPLSKKTQAKPLPKKSSSQKSSTTPPTKKSLQVKTKTQTPPKQNWNVVLPTSMSIRAREKALTLLDNIIEDFYQPAQHVAYVSGACFLFLGSYLALSFSGVIPQSQLHTAMLINSAGTTSMSTVAPGGEPTSPVFTLLESIPTELTGDSKFTFSLTNVKNVNISVYSLETGIQKNLAIDELVPGTFRYSLEVGTLFAGRFVAKVTADSSVDTNHYSYELGEFSVSPTTIVASSTATSTEPAVATSTVVEKTNSLSKTSSATKPVVEEHSTLHLRAESNLTGNTTLQITAPPEARFVELYVRPVRSINARFLGSAEKRYDKWYYFFNTINVPNGDYELFARSRISDVFNESNSVNVRVANIADFTLKKSATSTELLKEGETIDEAALPVRTFSESNFVDTSSSSKDAVEAEANATFIQHEGELTNRLDRYAVAVQSGDELLKKTALDELLKLKDQILLDVLNDSSKNYLADNISQEFDTRLEVLKKRISTFEELRRTAGSEDTRADTDKDGISDYDERSLYRTNPDLSDTDNDGFTDGIEVMRGFDPLSPLGETVINYQLPQNVFGLLKTAELRIDTVNPLINTVSNTESVTQAEIKGAGLPNSYITLYVMSNPNITTVRTGSDGSFSYTFEKELEDGEHTVYAAITDNTGTIVAMGEPYHFTKKGGNFYPTNGFSEGDKNAAALGSLAQVNMFNIVVGVGIIALGIILILLAVSLRRQPTIKDTDKSTL